METIAAYLQYLLLLHRTQLSEANDKMLAVQECYLSVCKEKDMLEKEETLIRVNEVYKILKYVYRLDMVFVLIEREKLKDQNDYLELFFVD